ncbi:MAG: UDP-3-O-(3-hydroxymyristoyl)glucosamine N-acyltransferase [bacterium]
MKLSEIAEHLDGTTVQGDDVSVRHVTEPGQGTENCAEIWLERNVHTTNPAIVDADLDRDEHGTILIVENLKEQLPGLLELFTDSEPEPTVHPSAEVLTDDFDPGTVSIGPNSYISSGVKLGRSVQVGPNVTVNGEVTIESGVRLHSGVRVESRARIGANSVVHANSVIGADGFGYDERDGQHQKIPQVGGVDIGENVEIGACSTIDRGTFGDTVIGDGTKIDNLVQIAHNCKVGKHCIFVAYSGLAGSVELGDHVTLGGQAGIKDHVTIEDEVTIAGRGGVINDVEDEGVVLSGFPARPRREDFRIKALIKRLPEMKDEINDLKEAVNKITGERESS